MPSSILPFKTSGCRQVMNQGASVEAEFVVVLKENLPPQNLRTLGDLEMSEYVAIGTVIGQFVADDEGNGPVTFRLGNNNPDLHRNFQSPMAFSPPGDPPILRNSSWKKMVPCGPGLCFHMRSIRATSFWRWKHWIWTAGYRVVPLR